MILPIFVGTPDYVGLLQHPAHMFSLGLISFPLFLSAFIGAIILAENDDITPVSGNLRGTKVVPNPQLVCMHLISGKFNV